MIFGLPYSKKDWAPLDLSVSNTSDSFKAISDFDALEAYIWGEIQSANARYGLGGYLEERNLYKSFSHFNEEEPRSIHLGIDLWAPAKTSIYLPCDGELITATIIDKEGDYGGLLIFRHEVNQQYIYSLYGHLAHESVLNIKNKSFRKGDKIAELGVYNENGNWPPHLHFQVMLSYDEVKQDFPGVCRKSEKKYYSSICPNPFNFAFYGSL